MKIYIIFLSAFFSISAFACECAGEPTVKQDWTGSADVFIGEVISVDSTTLNSVYGRNIYLFQVKVLKVFKNTYNIKYEMRSIYADPGNSCAYTFFVPGEKYLIYTNNDTGIISNVSICSRTNILRKVDNGEFKELQSLYNNSSKVTPQKIKLTSFVDSEEYDALKLKAFKIDNMSSTITILYFIVGILAILIILIGSLYLRLKKSLKT